MSRELLCQTVNSFGNPQLDTIPCVSIIVSFSESYLGEVRVKKGQNVKEKSVSWQTGKTLLHLGANIATAGRLSRGRKQVMIADENVIRLYGHRLPEMPLIAIVGTETEKTLETVFSVYKQLTEFKSDRATLVWCVGGGITTDIGAYAASTYMRGLPFILVPTTLLAQVDASIGGKCGVNFDGYKNLVGTFSHPEEIVVDYSFLQTLPDRELKNGFGEMIKHACIADYSLFKELESRDNLADQLQKGQKDALSLIEQSISIKIKIVSRDEREGGQRKLLNFGHTFAHAIEAETGIPHGQAVSIGMVMAIHLSVELGMLKKGNDGRLIHLLTQYGLPVTLPVSPERLIHALWHDKKKHGEEIDMVLLSEIGRAELVPVSIKRLKEFLSDLRQHP